MLILNVRPSQLSSFRVCWTLAVSGLSRGS